LGLLEPTPLQIVDFQLHTEMRFGNIANDEPSGISLEKLLAYVGIKYDTANGGTLRQSYIQFLLEIRLSSSIRQSKPQDQDRQTISQDIFTLNES